MAPCLRKRQTQGKIHFVLQPYSLVQPAVRLMTRSEGLWTNWGSLSPDKSRIFIIFLNPGAFRLNPANQLNCFFSLEFYRLAFKTSKI